MKSRRHCWRLPDCLSLKKRGSSEPGGTSASVHMAGQSGRPFLTSPVPAASVAGKHPNSEKGV